MDKPLVYPLMKKVTFYIPCFNAARFIENTIDAVLSQTYPIEEILIIDDGSLDNTLELIEKYKENVAIPIRLFSHKTNLGLAETRNTGVRNCRSEYIASIDADVKIAPDWLENIMEEFSSHDIAGVGGCLEETYKRSLADVWRNTHMRQSWGKKKLKNPSFLYGSNACYRKHAIIKAGMYDKRAKTNGEDVYIGKQILQSGQSLIYTPAAVCHHLRQDTVISIIRTFWRWKYFGNWIKIDLRTTLKANAVNFYRCLVLLSKDFSVKSPWGNFIIDMLYPFLAGYLDWKSYFGYLEHKGDI